MTLGSSPPQMPVMPRLPALSGLLAQQGGGGARGVGCSGCPPARRRGRRAPTALDLLAALPLVVRMLTLQTQRTTAGVRLRPLSAAAAACPWERRTAACRCRCRCPCCRSSLPCRQPPLPPPVWPCRCSRAWAPPLRRCKSVPSRLARVKEARDWPCTAMECTHCLSLTLRHAPPQPSQAHPSSFPKTSQCLLGLIGFQTTTAGNVRLIGGCLHFSV